MRLRSREVLVGCIDLLGLSERELARSAGLSHATVNHLVTGRRHSCSASTAQAIEQALDCSTGTLFMPVGAEEGQLRCADPLRGGRSGPARLRRSGVAR